MFKKIDIIMHLRLDSPRRNGSPLTCPSYLMAYPWNLAVSLSATNMYTFCTSDAAVCGNTYSGT